MAAIHVAGVRGDPCGALRWTAVQRTAPQGTPRSLRGHVVALGEKKPF